MHQGHDPPAEQAEITLKLAGPTDAGINLIAMGIPETAYIGIELRTTAPIEITPTIARTRTDQLQQFGMRKFPIGRDAQRKAGELCRIHIEGYHALRTRPEQCQCVVTRRRDRQAVTPFFDVQSLDEDICILPTLGVTNLREIRPCGHLTAHRLPPCRAPPGGWHRYCR